MSLPVIYGSNEPDPSNFDRIVHEGIVNELVPPEDLLEVNVEEGSCVLGGLSAAKYAKEQARRQAMEHLAGAKELRLAIGTTAIGRGLVGMN